MPLSIEHVAFGYDRHPQGRDPFLKNHLSVRVATSRLALEQFIVIADQYDIQILLDIHSCSNYVDWRKGRLDARPPYVDATRDDYEFTREESSCAATNPSTRACSSRGW